MGEIRERNLNTETGPETIQYRKCHLEVSFEPPDWQVCVVLEGYRKVWFVANADRAKAIRDAMWSVHEYWEDKRRERYRFGIAFALYAFGGIVLYWIAIMAFGRHGLLPIDESLWGLGKLAFWILAAIYVPYGLLVWIDFVDRNMRRPNSK